MAETNTDPLTVVLARSQLFGHGIYLGCSLAPPVTPQFALPEQGVLVLGPPRSGKTAAVVVPNIIAACGPVIAASTKADLLACTWATRSRLGPVMLYDPSGSVPDVPGVERVGWSPLGPARTWDQAVLVAESMVRAARPGAERGEAAHWSERASALLAALFHAGALAGQPFSKVVAGVDRHEPDEALGILARHGAERALDLLDGIVSTDGREQSGIWSTASGVLAGYRTDAALASAAVTPLDVARLLDHRGTLYVCAGSDQQRQAAPLVAGLLREVRAAAYQRSLAATMTGRSSSPPLLLALDELANIAPLHDLPTLVAEGGSQGVVTLACLQDLAQARARWDREADGFLSLFGTKLVLPGIGDTRTLEAISLLAGEHEVRAVSVSEGPHGRGLAALRRSATRTVSTRKERRYPVDRIARGAPGCLLGIEGAEPGFMRMTPWHSSWPWREAVLDSRARARERFGPVAARELGAVRDRSLGRR